MDQLTAITEPLREQRRVHPRSYLMDNKIHDEPSETEAIDGNVALMGPDGVSVVLTPEAAVETSDRLLETAMTAKGQQAEAERVLRERRAAGFEDTTPRAQSRTS